MNIDPTSPTDPCNACVCSRGPAQGYGIIPLLELGFVSALNLAEKFTHKGSSKSANSDCSPGTSNGPHGLTHANALLDFTTSVSQDANTYTTRSGRTLPVRGHVRVGGLGWFERSRVGAG